MSQPFELFKPQLFVSQIYEYDYKRYRMQEWHVLLKKIQQQEKEFIAFDLDTKTAIPFQAEKETYADFLKRVAYEKWMLEAQNFLSSEHLRQSFGDGYPILNQLLTHWDEVGFSSHLTCDELLQWIKKIHHLQEQVSSLILWLQGIYYSRWFFKKHFQLPKEDYEKLQSNIEIYETLLQQRIFALQKILIRRLHIMYSLKDFEHDELLMQIFMKAKSVGKLTQAQKLPESKPKLLVSNIFQTMSSWIDAQHRRAKSPW